MTHPAQRVQEDIASLDADQPPHPADDERFEREADGVPGSDAGGGARQAVPGRRSQQPSRRSRRYARWGIRMGCTGTPPARRVRMTGLRSGLDSTIATTVTPTPLE